MKQDPYFKFVAAALITAVLLAFFQPAAAAQPKPADTVVASNLVPASVKS